jgi:hypothetical protein
MTIVTQGVVHGNTIELDSSPGIEDGRLVHVVLSVAPPLSPDETHASGRVSAAGMMANYTEDDDAILEEIYRERKHDTRQGLAP